MHLDRLSKLASFLRDFPADLHFSIGVFAGFYLEEDPYEPVFFRPETGATAVTACALGYAGLLPEFMDAGFRTLAFKNEEGPLYKMEGIEHFVSTIHDPSVRGFRLSFHNNTQQELKAVCDFLDISYPYGCLKHSLYYRLFENYVTGNRTSTQLVALRLEQFLSTGKC